MTPFLSQAASFRRAIDGWPTERAAIYLTKEQAISIGLQPRQLLTGFISSSGSGAALQLAGISVPLPEHVRADSAGTLTVQAFLTRGGWILRPVAEEITETIEPTAPVAGSVLPSDTDQVSTLIPNISVTQVKPNSVEPLTQSHNSRLATGAIYGTRVDGINVLDTPTAPRPLNTSIAQETAVVVEEPLAEFYGQDSVHNSLLEVCPVEISNRWLGVLRNIDSSHEADPTILICSEKKISGNVGLSPEGIDLDPEIPGLRVSIPPTISPLPSIFFSGQNQLVRDQAFQSNPGQVFPEGLPLQSSDSAHSTPRNSRTRTGLRFFSNTSSNTAPHLRADSSTTEFAHPTQQPRLPSYAPLLSGFNLVGSEISFKDSAYDSITVIGSIGELGINRIDVPIGLPESHGLEAGFEGVSNTDLITAPDWWSDSSTSITSQPTQQRRLSSLTSSLSGVNPFGSDASFTPKATDTIMGMEPIGERTMLGIDPAALTNRPSPPSLDANPMRMTDPVARDLGLRDGEIVKGAVKADGDGLKLILNGLPIELPEGHGLRAGDTPTFRVFQSPDGLLLQPLRTPPVAQGSLSPAPLTMANTPPTSNNLMALLLHPNGLGALTQLLTSGLLEKTLSSLIAPELGASLRQGRQSMSRLTSTSLREAVAGSGLWAEASMTHGRGPMENDTKLLLLRLLRNSTADPAIKEALGEGLQDIESAQLQAVQAQTNQELLLNLVIPFSDANPVRASIHRPAPTLERPDPPFTVNLHSHNEFLGEIWLKTAITGKTQVDMTMWARLPEVATAASKGSRALARELERAGLKMNSFVVYNGARRDPAPDGAPHGAIVNVHA